MIDPKYYRILLALVLIYLHAIINAASLHTGGNNNNNVRPIRTVATVLRSLPVVTKVNEYWPTPNPNPEPIASIVLCETSDRSEAFIPDQVVSISQSSFFTSQNTFCNDCFDCFVRNRTEIDSDTHEVFCTVCNSQRPLIRNSSDILEYRIALSRLSSSQWDTFCVFLKGLFDLELVRCNNDLALHDFQFTCDTIFENILADCSGSQFTNLIDSNNNLFDINRSFCNLIDSCPLSFLFEHYRIQNDALNIQHHPTSSTSSTLTASGRIKKEQLQSKIDILIRRPGIILDRVISDRHLIYHAIDASQFESFCLILQASRPKLDILKVFHSVCELPDKETFFDYFLNDENLNFNMFKQVMICDGDRITYLSALSICLEAGNLIGAQKLLNSPKLTYNDLLITDRRTGMTVYGNFTSLDSSYIEKGLVLPEIPNLAFQKLLHRAYKFFDCILFTPLRFLAFFFLICFLFLSE